MKKTINKYKFILIALLAFGASSCDALLDDEITDYGATPVLVQFEDPAFTAFFLQTDAKPVYTYEVPVTLIGGRNQPINQSVEVTVAVAEESTAEEGVEFNLVDNTATIAAGEMTGTVTIEVISDNLDPFDPKTLVLEIVEISDLTISEVDDTAIILQAACELDLSSFYGTYDAVQNGDTEYTVTISEGPEENTLRVKGLYNRPNGETVIELSTDPTDPDVIYRSQEFEAALYNHSTYGAVWATTLNQDASAYNSCDNSMFLRFRRCVSIGCFGGSTGVALTKQDSGDGAGDGEAAE